MKIVFNSKHDDAVINEEIIKFFESLNHEIDDISMYAGSNNILEGIRTAESVAMNGNALGVVISDVPCGVMISANKVRDIRCVSVDDEEMAIRVKKDFNPNVIVLSAFSDGIIETIKAFFNTEYDFTRYDHEISTLLDYEESCGEHC